MKRKLALLLAGTMALATVPSLDVLAATSSIGKGLIVTNPETDTVYIGRETSITAGELTVPIGDILNVDNSSIIKFASDAYIQEGSTLQIQLENGRWATDAELSGVFGTATTLVDEVHLAGGAFTDSVTGGLELRRLNDTTILVVATSSITPDTSTSIAIPADFVPTGSVGSVTARVTSSNLPGISYEPIEISRDIENATGVTATVTSAKQESQVRATDASITLAENVQNQFKPNSTYTIALPDGYTFDSVPPANLAVMNTGANVQAKASTNWATTGNVIEYSQPTKETIEIHFSSDYDPEYSVSSIGSVITLSGLVINNRSGNYTDDVNVSIYGDGISHSSKIANFAPFSVETDTIGNPTIINSGTSSQNEVIFGNTTTSPSAITTVNDYTIVNSSVATNTLKITETIPGSFRGGDIVITFPEEVDVTGLDVVSASANTLLSGVDPENDSLAMGELAAPSGYVPISSPNYTGLQANSGKAYKSISFDDNEVVLEGLTSSDLTKAIDLRVKFELSAESDYSGDVVATISSSNSIDIPTPIQTDVLATFENVVDVDTTVKDIPVGYSTQTASDILIRENKSNTFKSGEVFTIALTDDFTSDDFGINDATVTATGGNLSVSDVEVYEKNTSESYISFKVTGATYGDDLGEILISGVSIYANNNVPTYNNGNVVSVEVSSTKTLTLPIEEEYIRFVDSDDVPESLYNEDVVIYMGQSVAYVGDEKVDLLGTPYISSDGNTMVPVKGIGYSLGIETSNVIYDPALKQATFILPTGNIAQITNGVPYATINSSKVPLVDAKGELVSPIIKEGRFYLPLRATCNTVFGVNVDWIGESDAVIVNSSGTMTELPLF